MLTTPYYQIEYVVMWFQCYGRPNISHCEMISFNGGVQVAQWFTAPSSWRLPGSKRGEREVCYLQDTIFAIPASSDWWPLRSPFSKTLPAYWKGGVFVAHPFLPCTGDGLMCRFFCYYFLGVGRLGGVSVLWYDIVLISILGNWDSAGRLTTLTTSYAGAKDLA